MIHPFPFFRSFAFIRQNFKPTVSAASWYRNSDEHTIDFVSHNRGCWSDHTLNEIWVVFSALCQIIYLNQFNWKNRKLWLLHNDSLSCLCVALSDIFLCATYVFNLFFCINFDIFLFFMQLLFSYRNISNVFCGKMSISTENSVSLSIMIQG